jgi:hypothetical protein
LLFREDTEAELFNRYTLGRTLDDTYTTAVQLGAQGLLARLVHPDRQLS